MEAVGIFCFVAFFGLILGSIFGYVIYYLLD